MESAKETKKNGNPTAAKKVAKEIKAKPATHQPTPVAMGDKETMWSLARRLFESGKPEKEVRATVHEWLLKNTSKEDALSFYATRMGYRAVRRAKAGLKASKKVVKQNGAKEATKG